MSSMMVPCCPAARARDLICNLKPSNSAARALTNRLAFVYPSLFVDLGLLRAIRRRKKTQHQLSLFRSLATAIVCSLRQNSAHLGTSAIPEHSITKVICAAWASALSAQPTPIPSPCCPAIPEAGWDVCAAVSAAAFSTISMASQPPGQMLYGSLKMPHSLRPDRKSTRLNSSHDQISYAVFCLKKKKKKGTTLPTNKRNRTTRPYGQTRN